MPLIILLGIGAILMTAKSARADDTPDPFLKWDNLIKKYSAKYSVPWRWIKAIMMNESSLGQNSAVARGLASPMDIEGSTSSDKKSWGLMQLTLPTARQFEPNATPAALNDPEVSVRIAARYLAWLISLKGLRNREAVIRSYNGGPGYATTAQGKRDTPAYYERFKTHLALVLERQPGDEYEIF